MTSRRALLRHLWSMVQTRAEAAALVMTLQRTAVVEAVVLFGMAAVGGLASITAIIVLIAVAAPESWRTPALLVLTLLLAGATGYAVMAGRRKITRDQPLIADFTRGLKLDVAMVNLALRDPDTDDAGKLAERERARAKVREAAVDKATAPESDSADASPVPDGGTAGTEAALRATTPTEREMPPASPLDQADVEPAVVAPVDTSPAGVSRGGDAAATGRAA